MPFSSDDVRAGLRDFFREAAYHVRNAPMADGAPQDEEADEAAQRAQLLDAIDAQLQNNEEVIEKLARDLNERYGCHPETISASSYTHMVGDAALQYALRTGTHDIEKLAEELSAFGQPPTIFFQPLSSVAVNARHYELCIGQDGHSLFDAYRGHYRAAAEGDCDNAATIADALGDRQRREATYHNCIPADMRASYSGAELEHALQERFFERVMQLSDEDLPLSAALAKYEEFPGWTAACIAGRAERQPPGSGMQLAQCVTDLYLAKRYPLSPSDVGKTEGDIREALADLPSDHPDRCYLEVMLGMRQPSACRDMVDE